MDGTLLNTEKQILDSSIEAIHEAVQHGKTVCVSSGRCMPEMAELMHTVPSIRFYTGAAGGFIYDSYTGEYIYKHAIPPEAVRSILEVTQHHDIMPILMSDDAYCQTDQIPKMPAYGAQQYQELYQKVFTHVDDIYECYFSKPFPVYKMNIYTPSSEITAHFHKLLVSPDTEIVFNEGIYLEITAKGVSKGTAYKALCAHLSVPPEETIAVGDECNDLAMLTASGFAIAMGNANPAVKAIANAIVADNNSGGCAEAIKDYLL